jgi:hypothetical protein
MCQDEITFNHLLAGQQLEAVQPIKMYGDDRIQIWLENGAFLSICSDAPLEIDLLGPSPPEREIMREIWEE